MCTSSVDDHIPLPQVSLTGPGPSALADIWSLKQDVEFALQCASAYVEYATNANPEASAEANPVPRALWNAGAISYRRAFNSGRGHIGGKSRLRLADVIDQVLSTQEQQTHREVLQMASRHVAHRVNDLEQASAPLILSHPSQGRSAIGIGTYGIHFIGPTVEFGQSFVSVCQRVAAFLQGEFDHCGDRLLKAVNETMDLDKLYAQAAQPG